MSFGVFCVASSRFLSSCDRLSQVAILQQIRMNRLKVEWACRPFCPVLCPSSFLKVKTGSSSSSALHCKLREALNYVASIAQSSHMTAEECLFSCWIQRPFISFKQQKRYETSTLSGDDSAQIPVTSGCSMWHNAAWYCRFASSWHLDHATCWCFISCVLHSGLMQLETLVLWRHALKSPWMTQGTTGLLPSKFQPILTLRLMV